LAILPSICQRVLPTWSILRFDNEFYLRSRESDMLETGAWFAFGTMMANLFFAKTVTLELFIKPSSFSAFICLMFAAAKTSAYPSLYLRAENLTTVKVEGGN